MSAYRWCLRLFSALVGVACVWGGQLANAQPTVERPLLPFEDPNKLPFDEEQYGLNSFGRGTAIRAIHNESVPAPFTPAELDDLQVPPHLPPIKRYYITCYYYGCRPWFIHPYSGAQLSPTDLFSTVHFTNPDWLLCATRPDGTMKSLAELLQDDPTLGEPLVVIDSPPHNNGASDPGQNGLVDQDNSVEQEEAQLEDEANGQAWDEINETVGSSLQLCPRPQIRPIWHRPYYGLYCLRVRICVPCFEGNEAHHLNRVRWRMWCRFKFRWHQPVCWRRWWWHRWCFRTLPSSPTQPVWRICPWRPMCMPHFFWSRSGPDWVFHCTSWNPYRRWCLYGCRYYFTPYIASNQINQAALPLVAGLGPNFQPVANVWRYCWPRPPVRYWPFRPYCTRWFWFRCNPWIWYRHFPPVFHAAVIGAKPAHGGGFADLDIGQLQAPDDPPNVPDGQAHNVGAVAVVDSFFDIFTDLGECRWRAVEEHLGDHNGDGFTQKNDSPPLNRVDRRTGGESLDQKTDDQPDVASGP